MVISAPSDLREILEQLPLKQRLEQARRWRDRDGDSIATGATRQALRELALRIQLLDARAERTEAERDVLTDLAAPALRDIVGVGIHTAARLLVTVGDNPERLHSDAAFAHLCGAVPDSCLVGQDQAASSRKSPV